MPEVSGGVNDNDIVRVAEALILEDFLRKKQPELPRADLIERIEEYCKKYQVPEDIKKMMHKIRINRNKVAHGLTTAAQMVDYTSPKIRAYQKYYYHSQTQQQEDQKKQRHKQVKYTVDISRQAVQKAPRRQKEKV